MVHGRDEQIIGIDIGIRPILKDFQISDIGVKFQTKYRYFDALEKFLLPWENMLNFFEVILIFGQKSKFIKLFLLVYDISIKELSIFLK